MVVIWWRPIVASEAGAHRRILHELLHRIPNRATLGSNIITPISQMRELKVSLPEVTWLVRGGALMCPRQPHVSHFSGLCSAVGLEWIPPDASPWVGLEHQLCPAGMGGPKSLAPLTP